MRGSRKGSNQRQQLREQTAVITKAPVKSASSSSVVAVPKAKRKAGEAHVKLLTNSSLARFQPEARKISTCAAFHHECRTALQDRLKGRIFKVETGMSETLEVEYQRGEIQEEGTCSAEKPLGALWHFFTTEKAKFKEDDHVSFLVKLTGQKKVPGAVGLKKLN